MTGQDAVKALLIGMDRDRFDYRKLTRLLEQQFSAALQHNAAELASIASDILNIVEAMEQRRHQRIDLVIAFLGAGQPVSVEAVIERVTGKVHDTLQSWWADLGYLARHCQTLNTRNGQLLMSQYEIMQRVLHGEKDVYAPA
ncbi:flagellar protein FlgN [Paludibacterium denitrificans]|uniref:Flagellar protein FlgN n=1 Tax=Paludibacterium denitrificans TaxID=2675226 RepID=A0A844G983_9NEIS|nr:flagellar protein FlgN [Paludibacterium denitrificans]MTD32913.1 flagellar protein FlgN [Paludibacterium denitrificans]